MQHQVPSNRSLSTPNIQYHIPIMNLLVEKLKQLHAELGPSFGEDDDPNNRVEMILRLSMSDEFADNLLRQRVTT